MFKIKINLSINIVFLCLSIFLGCRADGLTSFQEAEKSFKQGDYKSCITLINKIPYQKKLTFDEYKLRGLAYTNLHEYNVAVIDYRKSLQIRPNDTSILLHLAWGLLAQNKLDSAIQCFSEVINKNKNKWEALNGRGVCFLNKKKLDFALADFRQVLNINHMYLNKTDSALYDYNNAIKLQPENASYYLNRGMAYYLLTLKTDACNDWATAASMNNQEAKQYQEKFCRK